MKKIIALFIIFSSAIISFSQSVDTLILDKKEKNRYVIWLIPASAKNIYGLAIGPIGSESICKAHYTKYSHGINLQLIGQGLFQTFYISKLHFNDFYLSDSMQFNENSYETLPIRSMHNGLLISPFGTFTDKVNGFSFSLWMSMGRKVNGISFNLLWNLYSHVNGLSIGFFNHEVIMKGLQIGLINKTLNLNGIQFGLWNKNERRSLPFINWNFTKKK